MSLHDSFEYKRSKAKADELHSLLLDLDTTADLLYNNVQYPEVFNLLMELEDVRVKYYTLHYEYQAIVDAKGQKNG